MQGSIQDQNTMQSEMIFNENRFLNQSLIVQDCLKLTDLRQSEIKERYVNELSKINNSCRF